MMMGEIHCDACGKALPEDSGRDSVAVADKAGWYVEKDKGCWICSECISLFIEQAKMHKVVTEACEK